MNSKTLLKHIFLFTLLLIGLSAFATPVKFWWTGDRTQNGQMTIFNPDAQDGDTGIPIYSADIDNDGHMDALLSAMTGDGRLNNKSSCGELHVLFGVDSIKGLVDFANYNGTYENLCTIWGRSARDYFGSKSAAGDLDGDGTKDLIVGAMWSDTPDRVNSGEVYIIWGGSHLRNSFWDMADSNDVAELQVTFIIGAEADDKLGTWIDAGDVNNDGDIDLLIGAPRANGMMNDSSHDQTGEAYLIYGPFSRSDTINLANPQRPMTVIFGVDSADQMGNTVELADINGDSFDEIIVSASAQVVARLGDTDVDYTFERGGAADGPNNSRPACGEVYIIPGSAALPDTINLAAGMPAGSTIIYGAHGIESQNEVGGDEFGEEITCADVNNDGIIDVLFGAFRADGKNNDITWAGNNYLFYGRRNWPSVIDLADGLPDSVTAIYGGGLDWLTGDSTPLGDVNGDGFFDIIGGCVHGSGTYDIYKSGTIRIIFGKQELLPPIIDFAEQPDTLYSPLIQGSEVSDLMSYWGTTGDFNNDGYWDIITNVMHGDGPNNERHNAGDFYIISGEWITNHPGQPRFLSSVSDSFRVVLSWHDNQERGEDYHVILRSADGENYDSAGTVPYPVHTFIDSAVTAGETYTYRVVAVATNGTRSNPSYPLSVYVGGAVNEAGLPLVVNGIHWGFYNNEARDFYENHVLLGDSAYAFWDLYSTDNYPDSLLPIGWGIDSLAQHLYNHPVVLWMANGYDPDTSYDDGDMLYQFGPQLVSYLQSGGKLIIISKEMGSYLSPELQQAFTHTVNWGFELTVTNTAYLEPYYPHIEEIRKKVLALNPANLDPFSVDNSGCSMLLHTYGEPQEGNYQVDDFTWMSEISRGSIYDPYNIFIMSMRPYRADESDLRSAVTTVMYDLLDHYPMPTGVIAIPSDLGEIMVCWDEPIFPNLTGHYIMRKRHDGTGPVDTIGFAPPGTHQFFDMPPDPFSSYDYWMFSTHSDGRRSIDSWWATGFSLPGVANGPLLIVNGIDWSVYGAEATNFYNNRVIQGTRPFVFWDMFSTANYPAGYTPIGFGIDSLVEALWSTRSVVWIANAFNGDDQAFIAMTPMLNQYLDFGGNLMVISKEMNLFVDSTLKDRVGLTNWHPAVTWVGVDTMRSENPSLRNVGRIGGSNMSLCPPFSITASPNHLPLFRKNLSADSLLGVAGRVDADSAYNLILISLRPYRAEPNGLRNAMETIFNGIWQHILGNPVNEVVISRIGNQVQLRWTAAPGATSYKVCKVGSASYPHDPSTVVATTASLNWLDPVPVGSGSQYLYVVYPVYP